MELSNESMTGSNLYDKAEKEKLSKKEEVSNEHSSKSESSNKK